ncbi:hypothetical protein DFH09DRAFT_1362591 [Mycena vulgaris]|nr:hypothetical protein DFH09DRAFT_1362591 [Mycena vulgaris]
MRLSAVLISLALALPMLAAPVAYSNDLDLGSEKQTLSTLAAPVAIAVPLLGDESLAAETNPVKVKVKSSVKVKVKPKVKPATVPKKKLVKKPSKTVVKSGAKVPVKKVTPAVPKKKVPAKGTLAKPKVPAGKNGTAIGKPKAPVRKNGTTVRKPKAPVGTNGTAKACKINSGGKVTKTKGGKTKTSIRARALRHPSGQGTIKLFHGTKAANTRLLRSEGIQLDKTVSSGDFHHRPEVAGGFYLADSLIAAAQFSCHELNQGSPTQVDVLEFTWSGADFAVHEFGGETQEWEDFQDYNAGDEDVENFEDPFRAQAVEIFKNDMITGPMAGGFLGASCQHRTSHATLISSFFRVPDKDLTPDSFQYTVVTQAAADSLRFTQGGSAQFAAGVADLQDDCE